MTASTPLNLRSLRITGMRRPAADDDEVHLDQFLNLAVLDDRQRLGARHHPPETLVGLDHDVGQPFGLLLGVKGADGLAGILKSRVFLVDHDIGDQGHE